MPKKCHVLFERPLMYLINNNNNGFAFLKASRKTTIKHLHLLKISDFVRLVFDKQQVGCYLMSWHKQQLFWATNCKVVHCQGT